MFQAVSLLIILATVLIISRLATIALTVTGIPREIAKFQARSALTGAGFTTAESESLVNHPVRRRIIMGLMLTGSLGGAAGIATAISAFVGVSGFGAGVQRGFILLGGLVVLVVASRTNMFDRVTSKIFAGLVRRVADVDLRDYASLLRLSGEYGVDELYIEADDWLADKSLAELDLPHEGILVLGIVRADHTYLGAPKGGTRVRAGDTLVVYGRAPLLAELDERRADHTGQRAHEAAVAKQRAIEREQERQAGDNEAA